MRNLLIIAYIKRFLPLSADRQGLMTNYINNLLCRNSNINWENIMIHNFKKYIIYILLILNVLLFTNCSKSSKEISISNIDSTLIGTAVIEKQLGIKYNPPEMWISANAGLKKPPDRKIRYGVATFAPVNLFYNAGNKSVLNLGKIIPKNPNTFDLETYITQSTKKFEKGNIKRDSFEKDGVEFVRMKITFGVWFTYRIIFKNKQGKYIQFDYSLQSKYKKDELSAIVSSVGSIRLI